MQGAATRRLAYEKAHAFACAFSCRSLDLANVDCVWAFRAVSNLERNRVSLLDLVERNVLELVGVEEKVLCLAITLDEAESLVGLLGYNSLLHSENL